MTVLVTGGFGYIGSHTCVALLQAGRDVVVLDDLSNSVPLAGVELSRPSQNSALLSEPARARARKSVDVQSTFQSELSKSRRADSTGPSEFRTTL